MLSHWRDSSVMCALDGWPKIEMMAFKSDWNHGTTGDALGQCNFDGSEVSYCSSYASQLPDEHMQTFFAHELAHVYRLSTVPDLNDHITTGERDYWVEEQLVEEMTGDWGFDPWGWDEYHDEHLSDFRVEPYDSASRHPDAPSLMTTKSSKECLP